MSSFSTPPIIGSASIGTGAVTTTGILDGTIANADVSTSAAIAMSKLAGLTVSKALASDSSGVVAATSVTSTELGYVSGVTSAIQTQMNLKAPLASPTFSGTITTPLTASRAMVTGASNELAISAVTATELGYVSGVTSAIQTQMNLKSPLASPTFSGTITTPLTASRAITVNSSSQFTVSATTDTELGYVSGVTSAIQTQVNAKAALSNPAFTTGMSLTTATNAGLTVTDSTVTGILFGSGAETHSLVFGTTSAHPLVFFSNNTERGFIDSSGQWHVGLDSDTTNVNLRLNGLSITGANVGTLTNCPHTGNPALYVEVNVKGTTYCIPCFALS